MIDLAKAVGAPLGPASGAWTADDVILYQLGLGCTDLPYVYEDGLRVLPAFAVLQAAELIDTYQPAVDGLEYDPAMVLHGEQRVEVLGPLPAAAEWSCSGRIAAVHDKGSAAVTLVDTELTVGGEPVARTRFTLFMRGAGGFGGERGPAPEPFPDVDAPDVVVDVPVAENAALIYRLSGDRNPLHVDPEAARAAGFDRPILHGLCTYGMVLRAVVDALLGGDPGAVASWRGRFTGVVFPGDTLRVAMQRDGGRIGVAATTAAGQVLAGEVVTRTP